MGVFVDGVEYDIAIERANGEKLGFMIVKGSDRKERVNDWAPVISTTGEPQYSSGVWRPWTQSDWSGGLGQEIWDSSEKTRFYEAEGVETRIDGRVMLATAVTVTDPDIAAAQPVDFNGKIYMRTVGTGKLRWYEDGVGWSGSSGNEAPTDLIVWGDELFVAYGDSNNAWKMNTAGSWFDVGVQRSHWAVWDEKLWGAKGHEIFYTATAGSEWSAGIAVGDSSTTITSMCPFAQKLYIGKEDGLYYYDGSDVVQMIDCRNRLWSGNFVQMAEWEGYLYFNILRRIYKFSESAIVDITPEMYGDLTKESYGYGIPKAFVASPSALYVGFDLAENDYPCVLAYTGVGWHPIWKGASGRTFHGLGYSPELDWLIINDGDTRYRQLVSMSDMPYPTFGSSGHIITPRFDGNMPQTPKAVKSVILHTRDCSSAQKITVYYRKDGETSWTEVGDVTSSPQEELSLAPLAGALEVQSDIQFKLVLSTATPSLTPMLRHFTCMWLPRPSAVYAYVVNVRLGEPIPLS